jgi:NAD-dependent dihydropyrimidine dehydrogenase PreA subunit
MGIRRIDLDLCTGCELCVESCPQDVLRMSDRTGKPFIAYPRDCESCLLCEVTCPVEAIYVYPVLERRIPNPLDLGDVVD